MALVMEKNSTIKPNPSVQKLNADRIQPSTPRRMPAYGTQYALPLATEIVVDQEQSLELVRTVITAAVGIATALLTYFSSLSSSDKQHHLD